MPEKQPGEETYRIVDVLFRACDLKRHDKCLKVYKDDQLKMHAYCTCHCHEDVDIDA
jgi:hypothetical protein